MSVTVTGGVHYAHVVGSSLKDRSCFDGTVPRCFSCSSYVVCQNTTGSVGTGEAIFSLTGTPRNAQYNIGTDDTHRVLTSQSVVSLRDLWIILEGESLADDNFRSEAIITMAVCDPTLAFPDAANTNYLYQGVVRLSSDNIARPIPIPDIDGLVIASGLNVVCRMSFSVGPSCACSVSFHGVSVVDD